MINVYLDDIRPCPKGFVLARSAEECMLLLRESKIDILSLDHDLGWSQPTGFDVAKYIVDKQKFPREIYLHTSSEIGRSNMFQLLYRHKPEGTKVHMFGMPDEKMEDKV